ncbi:hypothetical protein [Pseudoalteromonas phage H103]|uniref:hypothetical protein n=1 Tax=Pseudoalteromonas phage H103 TaxID=1636200 RepID=UPI0006BD9F96|nr:hypothetical protein AVU31_gp35 [Pseudoalteromonas phage H103]AKA61211.1 hypothetical protein [Pseudoalteromonas phage H103]
MAWYKLDEEGNIEGLLKPLAPLINYVARLNGTDQYWQLSEAISIGSSNFALRLKVTTSFSGSQVHLTDSPEDFYFKIFITSNGIPSVLFGDGSQWVYSLNAVTNIADSKEHSIEVVKNSGQLYLLVDGVIEFQRDELTQVFAGIEFIGVRNSLSQYFNGSVYDFEVEINNTLTHSIPLTNKAQGSTQLATVGSVNATMVGYDESVWEQA